jgi:hypothetical protein
VEVLTRGPIHEAFAETVTFDPQPGLVAPKEPPVPIEELPPEQRPEGSNVTWIPGYWAWDEERNDFLWVSGIWRAIPPGRQWIPGYWGRTGQGAQWTSGYWADAKAGEIEYLPEPPATVEAGPNVAAPAADQTWLPGSWVWQQNRYAWQPGYWAAGQSDWTWTPSHYVWTPRGYVFVDGYYDYSLGRRGTVFAPVYFNSGAYSQPGFSYSPTMAISPAVFGSHLFLRPGYGHYYYGDYYGANYARAGYSPWFSYNSSRLGYDPFYAQAQWLHRQDRGWPQNIQADFQNRREHMNLRPPRTWAEQNTRRTIAGTPNPQHDAVVASLDDWAKNKDHALQFQGVDQAQRRQFAQQAQAVAQHREQRQTLDRQAAIPPAANSGTAREVHPARGTLSPSPIAALPPDRLGKDHTPPERHTVLKPDFSIAPTPRNGGGALNPVPASPQRGVDALGTQPPQVAPLAPQDGPRAGAKGPPPPRQNTTPPSPTTKRGGDAATAPARGRTDPPPKGAPPGKTNKSKQN